MREKIKINLPEDVSVIISILEKNGYEAYAVGGCVRDSILNRKPQDWDITTNAEPADVKRIFKNTKLPILCSKRCCKKCIII